MKILLHFLLRILLRLHLSIVLLGAALLAPSALALEGTLTQLKIETTLVPGPVDIAVYTPAGYDANRADAYPLVIQLHGGGGSSANMTNMAASLEEAFKRGLLPPVVSVMPSAQRSCYIDYQDSSQQWESFLMEDLISFMRAN